MSTTAGGAAQEHPTLGAGKICYLIIPAIDVEKSASFYRDVFHWRVRARGDGSVSFDDGVGEVSGMWMAGRAPAKDPGVLIFLMVRDADETAAAIRAHGGDIIQGVDKDAREVTAIFADPAGNHFGIYQEPSLAGQPPLGR